MKEENKRFNIELEVVTPLCVGAGNDNEWVKGADYVQKDGKVYVLDLKHAYELGIDVERLSQLFLNSDEHGICSLFGSKLEQVSKYIFTSPANCSNPIKTFLRSQLHDAPLVAGSSIKGAIRSALFKAYRPSLEEKPNLKNSGKEDKDVFGGIQDNFMKFIQVGDIEMSRTELVNTKIFNLNGSAKDWSGGWKHSGGRNGQTTNQFRPTGFNTLYECVSKGEKGFGTITFADYASVRPIDEMRKKTLWNGELKELFRIINDATYGYLVKEQEFFEEFPADKSEELIDCVDGLLKLIPQDDSYCLMKMSAGAGFHSITGDWQFDEYIDEPGFWPMNDRRNAGKKKYKSRKIAITKEGLKLMGFVLLRKLP